MKKFYTFLLIIISLTSQNIQAEILKAQLKADEDRLELTIGQINAPYYNTIAGNYRFNLIKNYYFLDYIHSISEFMAIQLILPQIQLKKDAYFDPNKPYLNGEASGLGDITLGAYLKGGSKYLWYHLLGGLQFRLNTGDYDESHVVNVSDNSFEISPVFYYTQFLDPDQIRAIDFGLKASFPRLNNSYVNPGSGEIMDYTPGTRVLGTIMYSFAFTGNTKKPDYIRMGLGMYFEGQGQSIMGNQIIPSSRKNGAKLNLTYHFEKDEALITNFNMDFDATNTYEGYGYSFTYRRQWE